MTRTYYRPDIDGLRAVAVISVMLYHLQSTWLPGGFIGVDVFFVISGFVVTSSLSQSKATSFWGFITQFYASRLARIMPALLATLLVTVVAATLFIPHAWLSQFSQETARFAFFGLSNWKLQTNLDTYFAPRAEYNPYTHTWSLGVEEQFYLIVPVIIYFWIKAKSLSKVPAQGLLHSGATISLAILALLSLASCIWESTTNPAFAFYSIAARFWELALGSLLFLLTISVNSKTTKLTPALPMKLQSLGAFVGLLTLGIGFVFANGTQFPWPWALLPALGTLLLIGGAHVQPSDPIRSTLGSRPLVWIGKRSYSLYLWHWPVYVLLRWTTGLSTPLEYAGALILTLLLAMFSYRFIEQPLRHNAWIEKRSPWMVVIGFVALTVLCSLGAKHLFSHPQRYSLSVVMKNQADWYQNSLVIYPQMGKYECLPERTSQAGSGDRAIYLKPKPGCGQKNVGAKQLFVMGDSHAGALFPVIESLSAQYALPTTIYSDGGCSVIDLKKPMAIGISAECNTLNQAAQNKILQQARPGDIIILPSLRMERFTDQWANFDIQDMNQKMFGEQAAPLRKAAVEDARQWLEPFTKAGLNVVMVAPPPIFKSPTFRCVDWFNQSNPACKAGLNMSQAELNALRHPILLELDYLKGTQAHIYIWDPFPALCPGKTCSAYLDGKPIFFDGDHLSNYGNWLVYADFSQWLQKNHLVNGQ